MLQFITTLTNNIEALSGSPVQVTINSISAGSVKIASTVVFLNGDASSASTYKTALTSGDVTSVFGTSFGGVAVDSSSVRTATVSNPSRFTCAYPPLSLGTITLPPLGHLSRGCMFPDVSKSLYAPCFMTYIFLTSSLMHVSLEIYSTACGT